MSNRPTPPTIPADLDCHWHARGGLVTTGPGKIIGKIMPGAISFDGLPTVTQWAAKRARTEAEAANNPTERFATFEDAIRYVATVDPEAMTEPAAGHEATCVKHPFPGVNGCVACDVAYAGRAER